MQPTVSVVHKPKVPVYNENYKPEDVKIIYEMLKEATDLVGGLHKVVDSGDVVLVKPNIVASEPPWTGVSTDCRVIEALIHLLKEVKVKKVIIGEHARWHGLLFHLFEVTGVEKAVKRAGGELLNLDLVPHVKTDIPDAKSIIQANIPKTYLDANVLINVPKLKTHVGNIITGCLKNLMGLLPTWDYAPYHRDNVHQTIVDLYKFFKPKLNIVDGIIAHEGHGPMYGSPVIDMNVVLAGTDAVAMDSVAAAIMSIDPLEVATTRLAWLQGLGVGDLKKITVKGRKIDEVRRTFKRAIENTIGYARYDGITYPYEAYVGGCCVGGCHCFMHEILDHLALTAEVEKVPPEKRKKLIAILGHNAPVPKNLPKDAVVVVYGDCAEEHKDKGMYFPTGCKEHPEIAKNMAREAFKKPPGTEISEACIGYPTTWPILAKKLTPPEIK